MSLVQILPRSKIFIDLGKPYSLHSHANLGNYKDGSPGFDSETERQPERQTAVDRLTVRLSNILADRDNRQAGSLCGNETIQLLYLIL